MVPDVFCSAHRQYASSALPIPGIQSRSSYKIQKITKDHIPIGVWPPINVHQHGYAETLPAYRNCFLQSHSESSTKKGQAYGYIALVGFESKPSQQVRCLCCLIQHNEVFFVYTSSDGLSGYIWMRQASSHILNVCLSDLCTSLTFDENHFTIRPIGLSAWTEFDLFRGDS